MALLEVVSNSITASVRLGVACVFVFFSFSKVLQIMSFIIFFSSVLVHLWASR